VPPFCPRQGCRHHLHPRGNDRWYWKWGFFSDRLFGRLQRFRCKSCLTCFCPQTFSVHYHIKRMIELPLFLKLIHSAASVRSIARLYGCSTATVGNRTDRLMRQALVTLSHIAAEAAGEEPLCADGLRSFCRSQYFPCDLTILVGTRSETVYGLQYALLRRSGSMSRRQKRLRAQLDRTVSFDPHATQTSFATLLDILLRLWLRRPQQRCLLYTDKHPAYRLAWRKHPHIQHLAARGWAAHQTVSSRQARTAANPLRAVNYMDREIRKDRADHQRETVCFSRNVPRMLGRLAIYFAYRNLLKIHRVRGSRSPGPRETLLHSHARFAGIPPHSQAAMAVALVSYRRFLSRELLSPFYRQLWMKQIVTPLKRRAEIVPKYALG
jgi:transposase-like protein